MKHMKREVSIIDAIDYVTCDLCGNEVGSKGLYDVDTVHISHEYGESYPDNSRVNEISVDMCGRCFDTKLVPWLTEQGAKPKIEELWG